MQISIDEDVVVRNGINVPLFLISLAVKAGVNIEDTLKNLLDKKAIVEQDGEYKITQRWNDKIDHILFESDKHIPSEKQLSSLIKDIMNIVPQGMMEGTPYYYKCNSREVCLSLQKFFKIYEIKCTNDEIKSAVRQYVDRFNGDYTYMQLLKNFIYKVDRETGEISSELASYIENMHDDTEDI